MNCKRSVERRRAASLIGMIWIVVAACSWFITATQATAEDTDPATIVSPNSIELAQQAAAKTVKLEVHELVDRYNYEIYSYDSLADKGNYAKLSDNDRKVLRQRLGNAPFTLHRFIAKVPQGNQQLLEVFVSADGRRLLYQRQGWRPGDQNARVPTNRDY